MLQNGVEQRQQFAPLTGGATVLPSVVWFPAQRDADASVWLRATPRLTLPDLPGAERVQQALAGDPLRGGPGGGFYHRGLA